MSTFNGKISALFVQGLFWRLGTSVIYGGLNLKFIFLVYLLPAHEHLPPQGRCSVEVIHREWELGLGFLSCA